MSEKFTPGPWCLGSSDRAVSDLSVSIGYQSRSDTTNGPTIARMVSKNGEEYHNAKLISAAPDLYAALSKTCSNALDLGYCHMADCNNCPNMAALRKARGEA